MIKNIVFDMGNVLIEWNPVKIISRFVEDARDVAAINAALFSNPDWAKLDEGTVTEEDILNGAKAALPERLHDDLEEVMDNWHYCMPVIVENNDLVKHLKDSGYGVYLLSNANKRFHSYNRECVPCLKFMDGCMISADEKCTKPSSEIYEKFFKKFDLNPEECLFIDDLSQNCEGARNAGMKTFCYDGNYDNLVEFLKENGVEIKE